MQTMQEHAARNQSRRRLNGYVVIKCCRMGIEKGRVASKSPHLKFGYFLSISQQEVSADITPPQPPHRVYLRVKK
jgi:hypothetical protein